jgi:hypothetical protein
MHNATPPADPGRTSAGRARGHILIVATALACAGLAAVTGCSAASSSAAGPGPAAKATAAATGGPTAASAPAVPATPTPTPAVSVPVSPSAPASTAPAGAVPTLGQLAGLFARGTGFGQVKPVEIFNGGDPTGLVTHVAWTSWGGAQAVATGVSDYVGPGQSVADGTEETATVVAFDLGTCDGKLMYQAVEWYFPQHGQAFDAAQYENICTGTYVPSP